MGNSANADGSRWLIAVEFGDQANISHWQQDGDQNKAQVAALIAKAHGNRTYPEEDQPLADMDKYWAQYTSIDPQIRAAATDQSVADPVSRLLNAERISTGISNEAFGNFADAVTRLSAANHAYYVRTYNATAGGLSLFIMLSLVLFPLTGVVAAWGCSAIERVLRIFEGAIFKMAPSRYLPPVRQVGLFQGTRYGKSG